MNHPLAWCRDHFAKESGNGNDKLLKKHYVGDLGLTTGLRRSPGEGKAIHSSILAR